MRVVIKRLFPEDSLYSAERQASPAGRGISNQLGTLQLTWSNLRKTRVLASPVNAIVRRFWPISFIVVTNLIALDFFSFVSIMIALDPE